MDSFAHGADTYDGNDFLNARLEKHMLIQSQRFGSIDVANEHIFLFPSGLIGMERYRQWALVPDPESTAMAWLISTSSDRLGLPLISPRKFFTDYRVRVSDRDIASLRLRPGATTYILTTVTDRSGSVTTNLRAPILFNMNERIGIQAVTIDDQPFRKVLPDNANVRAAA